MFETVGFSSDCCCCLVLYFHFSIGACVVSAVDEFLNLGEIVVRSYEPKKNTKKSAQFCITMLLSYKSQYSAKN